MRQVSWWIDEGVPARRVHLHAVREELGETGAYERIEDLHITGAWWRIRGGAHYLTYETEDPQDGGRTATTLRIRPDEVVLVRHGAQRWQQAFRQGAERTSRVETCGLTLPVEVMTHRLDVRVTPHGGRVRITFAQTIAGHTQQVRLWIRFAEEANDGGEADAGDETNAGP